MESMRSIQSVGSRTAVKAARAPAVDTHRSVAPARPAQNSFAPTTNAPSAQRAGYGLPCAKCRKYYSASLSACPVCHSTERVSPIAAIASPPPASQAEGIKRDQEKERILREFKSSLYSNHSQIRPSASSCAHAGEGSGAHESASVCKSCYARLQARVDLLEAVLHMDLKEAAQVIYDAVWADTSDATKTYQNAAHALLAELRKRAGMKAVLGRMQPLAH